MKKLIFLLFTITAISGFAQKEKSVSDQISIEGELNHPFVFNFDAAKEYQSQTLDSFVIYNHLHERKRAILHIKGILLSDLIQKAEINEKNPKLLSQFYIVCIASDGYQVVFSWNEIFNTDIGKGIILVTEADGQKTNSLSDRMTLLSAKDFATGRRYIKGLQKIIIKRVS
jgi:hypothetical protein